MHARTHARKLKEILILKTDEKFTKFIKICKKLKVYSLNERHLVSKIKSDAQLDTVKIGCSFHVRKTSNVNQDSQIHYKKQSLVGFTPLTRRHASRQNSTPTKSQQETQNCHISHRNRPACQSKVKFSNTRQSVLR